VTGTLVVIWAGINLLYLAKLKILAKQETARRERRGSVYTWTVEARRGGMIATRRKISREKAGKDNTIQPEYTKEVMKKV
jgi:hypothetical protein